MADRRLEHFNKAVELRKESTEAFWEYWHEFAIYTSLEFWIMVSILVVPLIILCFKIDKSKIFLIGFFGYSIHVIFAYTDSYGIGEGLWNYPFQVIPALPSLSLDSSLVPVAFMLLYQWCLHHKKNYYMYAVILSAVFSFAFKPIIVAMGMFVMYEKINYLHLFIAYVGVAFLAKILTNVFLWMEKKFKKPAS
ncbi:CBO0543 family protein [Bacillus salitolerans]|uniref:CBO0543 family protein n=1 Tax=Bacillus salitolerans TaxID=1437434 RepID=A0ABW4LYR4_9BACI